MVQTPARQPPARSAPPAPTEADDLFMLALEDDTEEAPWMSMGDLQFWSASSLAHSLRHHAQRHGLGWYVASMLPIRYYWPPPPRVLPSALPRKRRHKKFLSPDLLVARVPDRSRASLDADSEGFPPFVLEVVSPSSVEHDREYKRRAYDLLGAREYVLFTPREETASELAGYRRDATGAFVDWLPDAEGRLWSEELELYLVARGALLHARTAAGEWLLTPEQAEDARYQAEAEVARLRQELERYRRAERAPDDGSISPRP